MITVSVMKELNNLNFCPDIFDHEEKQLDKFMT